MKTLTMPCSLPASDLRSYQCYTVAPQREERQSLKKFYVGVDHSIWRPSTDRHIIGPPPGIPTILILALDYRFDTSHVAEFRRLSDQEPLNLITTPLLQHKQLLFGFNPFGNNDEA